MKVFFYIFVSAVYFLILNMYSYIHYIVNSILYLVQVAAKTIKIAIGAFEKISKVEIQECDTL